MDYPKYFNPKNSLKLFGMEENFNFLISIYQYGMSVSWL